LKIFYTKHFDAPTCEKFTEFHVDTHRTWWCCRQLKEHDKHFQLWNVKWAKFHFKDIATDGNIAFFPMSYCPYCGEEIEYEETYRNKYKPLSQKWKKWKHKSGCHGWN